MDMFERLQDDLIIHIISFLPTKHAVFTSVLSKRWKWLWCYANKSLVFDDSVSFLPALHEDVGYYGLESPDRVLPFINFVDRALRLIKVSQLDNFSLKMYPRHYSNPVQPWLDHIVRTRQAKQIQLHFSPFISMLCSSVSFPLETFNSASLRVLKLYFGYSDVLRVSDNSTRFFLPNLNILHFWMDGIGNKLWIFNSLFQAAPQLEEAYFGGNLTKSKVFCKIYAPSLRRLRIKFRSVEASNDFLINAPILEELLVVDESFQPYIVESNCLVNAKLDIGFSHLRKIQGLHTRIHWVCSLLRGISRVKALNLRAHTMDALSIYCSSMPNDIPQFSALRHLKLCFLNYISWDVIPKLLDHAPNLEVLVLSKDFKGKGTQFRRDSVWIQPSIVPVCLLSTLRQVEVWDCESHQAEFTLINYFLEHGEVLCTVLVELLPADSRDDLRFRQKLMSIPRVSKTCDLKVSVYPHYSQHRDSSTIRHLTKLQKRSPPEEMCFEDLRVFTDYFSDDHLILRTKKFKVYRGKLYRSNSFDSPVTEVVVKKWIIRAKSPYNKHKENSVCSFREELKLLEHPDFKYHPLFTSPLGYCAEDNNERLGLVYDFKPLDCLENLIPKDSFKWLQRIKVALVLACISEYMHKKHGDLPSVTPRLSPSSVILDEYYMPTLFNFNRRRGHFIEDDHYDIETMYDDTRSDLDVCQYGLTLLGLISKRVHRCPVGRDHTSECRTMGRWASMQSEDRYSSSPLCKSQPPLVHKNLMDDSTYDTVDGLKITRLAMRCVDYTQHRPSMHAIVKYLCKLRVVRENWNVLDCDNIIREHLNNVLVSR